ncbi:MAG: PQQ-binding-like beta-propeller repeat protein [Planctomycetaceae bacterium]|nr:PQQ-binding-like beta-propeller repeat protein [Planctomycetaceae bacterium]
MMRFSLVTLIALFSFAQLHAQDNWPRWRGPQQDGHYAGTEAPLKWNQSDIVWRTELPGSGQSSPCIWRDRIFLTAEKGNGAERIVLAVDKKSGKILWEQSVWKGEPEPSHALNGWASASCATDGERVYAFFGIGGLHCLTVDGKPVWSKDLGDFQGPWGTAASPVLVRDMLIQNCDADANARLMAFDKKNGQEIWSTKRDDARGWSTPILITVEGHEELILNGDARVTAYNPNTGEELWFCKSFTGRGAPTATFANNLIHMINGKPGDCYAVRPGGRGDVTDSHMVWHARRPKGRDLPSPVVIGEYMVTANMDGVYSTFNSLTGKQEALFRIGGRHVATPVSYRGKAVFIDEKGKSTVVDPPRKVIAENSLGDRDGEIFRSSVIPNGEFVFIRSTKALYKVGK